MPRLARRLGSRAYVSALLSLTLLACGGSKKPPQPVLPPEGAGGTGIKNDRQIVPPETPEAPPGAEGVGPVSSVRSQRATSALVAAWGVGHAVPAQIGGDTGAGGQTGSGGRGIVNSGGMIGTAGTNIGGIGNPL
ncbi:MAG: hypothetical protein ACOY0T_16535 [Myxococcota bacterium]